MVLAPECILPMMWCHLRTNPLIDLSFRYFPVLLFGVLHPQSFLSSKSQQFFLNNSKTISFPQWFLFYITFSLPERSVAGCALYIFPRPPSQGQYPAQSLRPMTEFGPGLVGERFLLFFNIKQKDNTLNCFWFNIILYNLLLYSWIWCSRDFFANVIYYYSIFIPYSSILKFQLMGQPFFIY